ncbi:MAG: hypothetical protein ABJP48_11130 [Erythrobacter sp.]
MLNHVLKISTVLCCAPCFAAAPASALAQSHAYLYSGEGIYDELDYLCDSTDGQTIFAVIKPTPGHASHTLSFDRIGFANAQNHWVKLGDADGGAGQIIYPLNDHESGENRGHVHTINPGALGDPADIALPTLSSITLDRERTECRFDKDAVFYGVTDEHSYMILRGEDGGFILNTWRVKQPDGEQEDFNFDTARRDDQGNQLYSFATGHTLMTFVVPPNTENGGAKITYEHDSGGIIEEPMRAYIAAE